MNRRKEKLYCIDRQGNLNFALRSDLVRRDGCSDSGWEHPVASILIMAVCCILDFVMFHQLFSGFLYDSVQVRMLSIIGMLVGFDLSVIYAGIVLKKRKQGIRADMIAIVPAVMAFVTAFIANVVLRIAVRKLAIPDMVFAITFNDGEESGAALNANFPMIYALFASALPLITSFVSFCVSYQSADPLKARMQRLKKEQIRTEDAIAQIEAILREYEMDPNHLERLLKEDDQKYGNMLAMIRERTLLYCDYVRERLKEHLGDPASSNELSRDNREHLLMLLGADKADGAGEGDGV